MSHFEPVEFERPAKARDPVAPLTITKIDVEALEPIFEQIEKEMDKISKGSSDLTAYAINNGRFASPVHNSFKTMRADPTVKTIKGFLQLARVEFSAKASDQFSRWISPAVSEVPNE